jgi:hypothetical protein
MYIIFRAYDMYMTNIKAAPYVDPIRLHRDGKLDFEADKFTVTPEGPGQVFVVQRG